MYLIDARTLGPERFDTEMLTPPYAVLSHTWSDFEVPLDDAKVFVRGESHSRAYQIRKTCEQALADGIGWARMDTHCTNRRSAQFIESCCAAISPPTGTDTISPAPVCECVYGVGRQLVRHRAIKLRSIHSNDGESAKPVGAYVVKRLP